MRKLPENLENPIDNQIISLYTKDFMDKLHALNVTPNMITTVGNIFRGLSVYFLFKGQKLYFVVLYILGYLCDCLDGHYARSYGMTSEFGDFYDHASDIIFYLALLYYIFFKSSLVDSPQYKYVIAAFALCVFLMFVHLGCQQIYFGGTGEYMDTCQNLCGGVEWLDWTKYFGCGTHIGLTSLLAFIF